MRSLSPDEAELWAKVTATIRPLSRDRADAPSIEGGSQSLQARPKGRNPPQRPMDSSPFRIENIRNRTLDGGWDRRLRSGRVEPDRVLDLHGHSLDRAWDAIDQALERAIASGDRIMLLITGHERKGEEPVERGRIRAVVHDWLAVSRHSPHIAAVRGAHRRHGGGGSLYLILRKV